MSDPKVSPAHYENSTSYDPQGSGEEHDAFFASVAPGVANSGNLAHKWDVPGDHSNSSEPPSDLKGD